MNYQVITLLNCINYPALAKNDRYILYITLLNKIMVHWSKMAVTYIYIMTLQAACLQQRFVHQIVILVYGIETGGKK